jgi:polyisoprenyl-teichoic acid--peptidoglycan teichoic acid transferase
MAASRIKRRKTKKRKRSITLLSALFLLLTIGIVYSAIEFQAGKNEAASNISEEGPEEVEKTNKEFEENFKGESTDVEKTNVLILGVDTSSKSNKARTDTIMIAQYDPKNKTAKIASIMRDTYVSIPGHGSNKINSSFFYGGPELIRQTIKENFGIDTEYYAVINFDGFTDVVDTIAPNGVEVDVEKRMKYTDVAGGLYIDLYKGLQRLDGEQLLHYARYRHDSESDFGRVRRQQQVISVVKDELLSFSGLTKIPRLIGTVQPYIHTNIGEGKMLKLATSFLMNPVDKIESIRIPVEGSYWLDSFKHAGSVIAINKVKNEKALEEFFNRSVDEQSSSASTDENLDDENS